MKKIAISQRIEVDSQTHEMRDSLDIAWANLLTAMNYRLIPVPSHSDVAGFLATVEPTGMILTGGNDLSSSNDSEASIIRDKTETIMLEYALGANIPVLGVCRGAQFLSQRFGGIVSELNDHAGVRHKIHSQEKSRFHQFLSHNPEVNSYHNYGISSLPENFECCATSQDGTIEAIAHKELRIFAQLWHPEREMPFDQWNLELIKNLLG